MEFKKRKEAEAWELEDQLEGLKEQLDLGHVTQEEYEQKKKMLKKRAQKERCMNVLREIRACGCGTTVTKL